MGAPDVVFLGRKISEKRKKIEEKILDSASDIMNKNGYAGATMADIARDAGITEPTLYQYFGGKENLLFSVIERKMEDSLLYLNDHLMGITGGYNKLRKLIWAHLKYNETNPIYLKLLLTEGRANRNYYKTRAYRLSRKYAGIVMGILEEGVTEGSFQPDLNLRLARELILGVLDLEAYTVLVIEEITDSLPDYEDIMKLVDRMLLQKDPTNDLEMGKKQRILNAAVKAFAKKGYADATISEIAGLAKVSDGTVYEYFMNKEELLLSIPEERFQVHLKQIKNTFDIGRSNVNKLQQFISHHFILFLDDYDFLIVYLLLIQLNRHFAKSRAYKSLSYYLNHLEEIITDGIKDNSFAPDCNPRVFRNMFWGVFTHMTIRWFVIGRTEETDKLSEIKEITDLLVRSVAVDA